MNDQSKDNNDNAEGILTTEFLNFIKTSKKINDKKKKIDELNKYLISNPTYLSSNENSKKISELYSILISNLNENNNNYVSSQMKLIETLIDQNNSSNNEFKNFSEEALPKLFDKYYLQNPKINENLTTLLSKFANKNILTMNDYYPLIENLSLEEEDNYRENVVKFIYEQINDKKEIQINNMPKNIIDIIQKLSSEEDEEVSDIAKKSLGLLNDRNNPQKNNNPEINKEKDEKNKDELQKDENIINDKENNNELENKKDPVYDKNEIEDVKQITEIPEIVIEPELLNKKEIKNNEDNNSPNKKDMSSSKEKDDGITQKDPILPDEKVNEVSKSQEKNKEDNNQKTNQEIENKIKDTEKMTENESPTKKEGSGVKRMALNNRLNKFRKQFGKSKKNNDKEVEDPTENTESTNKINEEAKDEEKEEEKNIPNDKKENTSLNKNVNNIKDNDKDTNKNNKDNVITEKKSETNFNTEKNDTSDLEKNIESDKKENKKDEAKDKETPNNLENTAKKEELNKSDKKDITISDQDDNRPIHPMTTPSKQTEDERPIHPMKPVTNINDDDRPIHPMTKPVNQSEDDRPIHPMTASTNQVEDDRPIHPMTKSNNVNDDDRPIHPMTLSTNVKDDDRPIHPMTISPTTQKDLSANEKEERTISNKEIETSSEKKETPQKEKEKEISKFEISEKNNSPIEEKEKEYINEVEKEEINIHDNANSLEEFQKKLEAALEKENSEQNKDESNENKSNAQDQKEESKYDNIKSILGNEIVESLFSSKWEIKKHGYELINNFVENTPENEYNINDLLDYIRMKLKNYKETNFNINREAINIFTTIAKKKIISKENLLNIIMAYYEKITDIKLKNNILDLLNASIDYLEPSSLIKQLLPKLSKKNNVKLFIEYSAFIGKIIEEYDTKSLPNKEIIDFCKIMANNSNPQVRNVATTLICALYKHLGNDVKLLIKDIKESTLKIIEAELQKVTVIDPKESQKTKKKVVQKEGTKNDKKRASICGGNDLIPSVDISKLITSQLLKNISEGKWPEKKDAIEQIEKILINANMKILPTGLNDLMNLIKSKLNDGNKNLVKMLISLLTKLIESLKQGFRQWTKQIAINLIPILSDKNQILRKDCQLCFDKWVENVGFESLVINIPQFLITDNTEMRTEIMNFLIKYKNKFTKNNGENIYKELINPLLICLQDRSASIRTQAEEIIKQSLDFVQLKSYYKKCKDFKPAITNSLKLILDKIQEETNVVEKEKTNVNNYNTVNVNSNNKINDENNNININEIINSNGNDEKEENILNSTLPNSSRKKTYSKRFLVQSLKKTDINENGGETDDSSAKVNRKKSSADKKYTLNKSLNLDDDKKSSDKNVKNNNKNLQKLVTSKTKFSTSMGGGGSCILTKKDLVKKKSGLVMNNVFINNVKVVPSKMKRIEKDRISKISLDTFSKEYERKLKETCKGLFTEEFSKLIFCDDFKKEVQALKEMKFQIDNKEYISLYLDNFDLIIKILGIKINGNLNPTLCKNLFEFLDSVYKMILENSYQINEIEANITTSLLIDKLSLNNSTLKEYLLTLLNKFIEIADPNKIMITILNNSLAKNNKIKTDILDITIELYLGKKLNISTKNFIKIFAKYISINDNAVKSKTLLLFKEIYSNMGDDFFVLIEFLPEKDKTFLQNNLFIDNGNEDVEEEIEIKDTKNCMDSSDDDDYYEENSPPNQKNNNQNNFFNEYNKNNNNNYGNNNINDKNNNESLDENTSDNNIKNTSKDSSNLENLFTVLNNLSKGDITERINSIIVIHDIICSKYQNNKDILIPNIDNIIRSFLKVTHEFLSTDDFEKIPLKFAKYVSTVLCKIAINKELISKLSFKMIYELCAELLNYLLINGLDKIGQNQEGSIIFKSMNSTMLRIIDNCEKTSVILVLLEIIKQNLMNEDKRIGSLAVKCLLKATENFDSIVNSLSIEKILLQIHLLLVVFEKNYPDLKTNNQADMIIIKFIKNLINDMVKSRKEKIVEDYVQSVKNHQISDKYIISWIKNSLDNLNKNGGAKVPTKNENVSGKQNINEVIGEKNVDKGKDGNGGNNVEKKEKNGGKVENGGEGNNEEAMNKINLLKKKWNDLNKNKK